MELCKGELFKAVHSCAWQKQDCSAEQCGLRAVLDCATTVEGYQEESAVCRDVQRVLVRSWGRVRRQVRCGGCVQSVRHGCSARWLCQDRGAVWGTGSCAAQAAWGCRESCAGYRGRSAGRWEGVGRAEPCCAVAEEEEAAALIRIRAGAGARFSSGQ